MPDGVRATFWRVLASDKSSSRFSKAIHALLTNDRQTEFTVSLSQATEGEIGGIHSEPTGSVWPGLSERADVSLPAGSPTRPREGPILMGRATNRSARFTGGKVNRPGFSRHWGVWGDRFPRSVIRSGLPEKPRPALRPAPAPVPPRRGGGSRRPDHHHPDRPHRRPGPGADPVADLHLTLRVQAVRGSGQVLVQKDAENPPAPADPIGTCRLWSSLDHAPRVGNGRLAEP